jgi:hypothetical protein
VTLVYHDDDNQEIRFSRSISASGVSSYKLGSKDVTYEAYEEVLQKIGKIEELAMDTFILYLKLKLVH